MSIIRSSITSVTNSVRIYVQHANKGQRNDLSAVSVLLLNMYFKRARPYSHLSVCERKSRWHADTKQSWQRLRVEILSSSQDERSFVSFLQRSSQPFCNAM